VAAHRESVALALAHGVPVIAGTDAGAPGMRHPSLVDEMECLVDCGMTPIDALRAATSSAAAALGLTGRVGQLVPGARADLVLLDGNPFVSPSALRGVWGVVRGQRFVRGAGHQG
jgi:imidazolonepropionase-like amidohydrolase